VLPARLTADGYDDTREHVARLGRLEWSPDGGDPVAAVPVPGGLVEFLPSVDLDLDAAARKRAEERVRTQAEIDRSEAKLGNPGFVEKAPPHVVQAERDKLERLKAELRALEEEG
jgi:valyl-tRNA synthetase